MVVLRVRRMGDWGMEWNWLLEKDEMVLKDKKKGNGKGHDSRRSSVGGLLLPHPRI